MEAFTVAAASAAITKIVDLVRNSLGESEPKVPKIVWNAGALILGVVGAFVFDIEPVDLAGVQAQGAALKVLTGLVVGGLAYYVVIGGLQGPRKTGGSRSGTRS